jgi:hypothetical protein
MVWDYILSSFLKMFFFFFKKKKFWAYVYIYFEHSILVICSNQIKIRLLYMTQKFQIIVMVLAQLCLSALFIDSKLQRTKESNIDEIELL